MKYTGKQVDHAGKKLRSILLKDTSDKLSEAMDVMSYWRASHTDALELAFIKLQVITLKEDANAIFVKRLKVIAKLTAFSNSLKNIDARINERGSAGFILLRIDIPKTTVYSLFFEATAAEQAEMEYVRLEKKYSAESDNVVALVSATAVGGIKEAYPNFFADSSNFLQHLTLVLNI